MPDGPAPTMATTSGWPLADIPDTLRPPRRSADRDRIALGLRRLGFRRRLGLGLTAPPAAAGPARAATAPPVVPAVVPGAAVGLLLRLDRHVVQLHAPAVAVRALSRERLEQ